MFYSPFFRSLSPFLIGTPNDFFPVTRKPASFWFSGVFYCFRSASRSMSDPIRELEKYGRKKAKTGKLEDGPASYHSPWYLFDAFGHSPDVGIENFAANVREEKAAAGGSGEEAAVELVDPLMIFDSGIMMMILNKLDARSVARCRLVSREWLKVASSDIIWAPKCHELWLGKAHIPHTSKVPGLSKLSAYSLSLMDSKRVSSPLSPPKPRYMHEIMYDTL